MADPCDDSPFMSAPNPLLNTGRRYLTLHQVDRAGNCYNDATSSGLDLSDCNPEISHTLNNEPGTFQQPGADAKSIDFAKLVADDFIVVTFDIPFKAMYIYREMYSYCKYGILADGTPLSEKTDPSQVAVSRAYLICWGADAEEKLRLRSTGPNTQKVDVGQMIYPKSVTWDWKAGRKDFITVRLTGSVIEAEQVPVEGQGTDTNWWNMFMGFYLAAITGTITGSPFVGWFTWQQISAWLNGGEGGPGDQ